eukprot:6176636-Pleurochrysis_carterae.AAC.1
MGMLAESSRVSHSCILSTSVGSLNQTSSRPLASPLIPQAAKADLEAKLASNPQQSAQSAPTSDEAEEDASLLKAALAQKEVELAAADKLLVEAKAANVEAEVCQRYLHTSRPAASQKTTITKKDARTCSVYAQAHAQFTHAHAHARTCSVYAPFARYVVAHAQAKLLAMREEALKLKEAALAAEEATLDTQVALP